MKEVPSLQITAVITGAKMRTNALLSTCARSYKSVGLEHLYNGLLKLVKVHNIELSGSNG